MFGCLQMTIKLRLELQVHFTYFTPPAFCMCMICKRVNYIYQAGLTSPPQLNTNTTCSTLLFALTFSLNSSCGHFCTSLGVSLRQSNKEFSIGTWTATGENLKCYHVITDACACDQRGAAPHVRAYLFSAVPRLPIAVKILFVQI